MKYQELREKLEQAQSLLAEVYGWACETGSVVESLMSCADGCICEARDALTKEREAEHERIEAAIRQELDEDAAAEAAWLVIQEEEAGRIAAQEREWAEDEGRDPAERTSVDVLGKR